MQNNRQAGFTLIEWLIALSIFMILLSLSFISFKPQQALLEERTFFTQLQMDILYAQNYAIAHQKSLYLQINPSQKSYYIRADPITGILIFRTYKSNIVVNYNSGSINFTINPKGNVSKFATYPVSIGEKNYTFTIQIGKGRFYVTKW